MKRFIVFILVLITAQALAGKLEKGFERLAVYDYFKAKEYFLDAYKGDTAAAAFGLSSIFISEKNPYFDLDSARRYILISSDAMTRVKTRTAKDYAELGVTNSAIDSLSSLVCEKAYAFAVDADSVAAYDHYITFFQSCSRYSDAVRLRNATAYRDAQIVNTSAAYKNFVTTFPEAKEVTEAKAKFEERLYSEATRKKDLNSYEQFISEYPESPYRKEAERMIYSLSVPEKSLEQLVAFARKYSSSSFRDEAWREIYKISLKEINQESYTKFRNEYPDFPFMNELESDFLLANYTFLPVKRAGKWGFINENGQEMIKPVYDDVSVFSEGLCAVVREGKAGYINKSGKIVIPFLFAEAEDFHSGTAVVKPDSLYALINREGEILIPQAYDELSDPSDGFCIGMKNGRSAYVAKTGKPLTPFMFDVANDFKEGYAIASTEGKYGLIDLSGAFSIQPKFEELVWIGIAKVKAQNQEGRWGILNVRGDTLTGFSYDYIGDYVMQRALIVKAGKCGFVNDSGAVIIPLNFQYSANLKSDGYFKNGYQSLRYKNKPVIIDTAGTIYNFPLAEAIGDYTAGFVPLMRNKKWGYADLQNKMIIPAKYDGAFSFVNGLAEVRVKKESGVIDTTGKTVVAVLYDDIEIRPFGIVVKKSNHYGILQYNGLLYLPCEYDGFDMVNDKVLKTLRGDKFSYLNIKSGKFIYSLD